jgi:hypothetical protein
VGEVTEAEALRFGEDLPVEERRSVLERRLQAMVGGLDPAASAEVGPLRVHESREDPSWPVRLRKGERGWRLLLPADLCEKQGAESVLEGVLSQALRLLDRYRPREEVAEGPPAP